MQIQTNPSKMLNHRNSWYQPYGIFLHAFRPVFMPGTAQQCCKSCYKCIYPCWTETLSVHEFIQTCWWVTQSKHPYLIPYCSPSPPFHTGTMTRSIPEFWYSHGHVNPGLTWVEPGILTRLASRVWPVFATHLHRNRIVSVKKWRKKMNVDWARDEAAFADKDRR